MSKETSVLEKFTLTGKTAVVTGGTGVLGSAIARGLAAAGAEVAILGRRQLKGEAIAQRIVEEGGSALMIQADVLDHQSLSQAASVVRHTWGHLDVLVNCAGGNVPGASVAANTSVFKLEPGALSSVFDLNFFGTFWPILVFCEVMAGQQSGSIINISSMSAQKPLTRVVGYGAAKAAVENLTKWLAAEFARKYGSRIRVNAIAPGFFLGEQNRAMLVADDGSLTERGQAIIAHTPLGRFGEPDDLVGTSIWLASDASRFVTGVIVPIDGGFSAFSGV
jgi:NAD(P)-dependent dehydrogenase (short-subunit alcohol dehydrogenase family)